MKPYPVAEMFHGIQGEGLYTGTPMTFIRLVGCSVGKAICTHCDTDFERTNVWRGGGMLALDEIMHFVGDDRHVCVTGGEPLDRDLEPLYAALTPYQQLHIETSGTRDFRALPFREYVWVTVSPKPGYVVEALPTADEVKIIVPGLGDGPGWPDLQVALTLADRGTLTYLQPRNGRFDIDPENLKYCQDLVWQYPQLRLSVQTHKLLRLR